MNENDINYAPSESNSEPKEGFTFKWFNLLLGAAIFLWMTDGSNPFTTDWTFYLSLAVVVIIHELGHVIFGKSFGCFIQEMQVFFLSFISYKPKQVPNGSSWRDITWSLGVLPLGGVTVFKSRKPDNGYEVDGMATSPYIEDKPAWQRMLISAGGVLFNIATFLILYFAMPIISNEGHHFWGSLMSCSLILAILNILPIYPLDGGSIVFALYEMTTGKKPSPKFSQACGWIGFIFIVLFFWVFPEWLDGILSKIFGMIF